MKMACPESHQGYLCEFIPSLSDDFYCKKCSLVARKLTITSCCGESFCYACIADIQQQILPCPSCGHRNFKIFEHIKCQRQLEGSQVLCNMGGRGCDWFGMLGQLDDHLDPDQDNCQHVDTNCPLGCHQTLPKNMVERHLAIDCVKRVYACQHCGFNATYEVVVGTHWPKCIYLPLLCPNRCGVTCERNSMDDHMRTCRLEEVGCEFSNVGCDKRFERQEQMEHASQNHQEHLALIATAVGNLNQRLWKKLQELEHTFQEENKKHEETKKKLEQKTQDQELEKRVKVQELKLHELECKLREENKKPRGEERTLEGIIQDQKLEKSLEEQVLKLECKLCEENKKPQGEERTLESVVQYQKLEKRLEEQERKSQELSQIFQNLLQEQDKKLTSLLKKSNWNEISVRDVANDILVSKRAFVMEHFSKEKARDKWNDWKSPALYTHFHGYKFCIGIDANGDGPSRGNAMRVYLCAMQGEYDHELKWMAKASFTIEMVGRRGKDNVKSESGIISWAKPNRAYRCVFCFGGSVSGAPIFLEHTKLNNFLRRDTLSFRLTNITVD